MVSAIVKKILWSIPLLLLVSMIMFGVIHMLPGNAALVMLGDAGGSAEQVQKLEESMGLTDPLYVQYFTGFKFCQRGYGDFLFDVTTCSQKNC